MVDVLFKISIIITFASPVLLFTTFWKAKQISMSRNPQMSFEWPEMCLQYRGCCLIVFSYRLIRLISWKSCSTSIFQNKISAPLVSGKYEKNNFPRLLSYRGQQNTKYFLYHKQEFRGMLLLWGSQYFGIANNDEKMATVESDWPNSIYKIVSTHSHS